MKIAQLCSSSDRLKRDLSKKERKASGVWVDVG